MSNQWHTLFILNTMHHQPHHHIYTQEHNNQHINPMGWPSLASISLLFKTVLYAKLISGTTTEVTGSALRRRHVNTDWIACYMCRLLTSTTASSSEANKQVHLAAMQCPQHIKFSTMCQTGKASNLVAHTILDHSSYPHCDTCSVHVGMGCHGIPLCKYSNQINKTSLGDDIVTLKNLVGPKVI